MKPFVDKKHFKLSSGKCLWQELVKSPQALNLFCFSSLSNIRTKSCRPPSRKGEGVDTVLSLTITEHWLCPACRWNHFKSAAKQIAGLLAGSVMSKPHRWQGCWQVQWCPNPTDGRAAGRFNDVQTTQMAGLLAGSVMSKPQRWQDCWQGQWCPNHRDGRAAGRFSDVQTTEMAGLLAGSVMSKPHRWQDCWQVQWFPNHRDGRAAGSFSDVPTTQMAVLLAGSVMSKPHRWQGCWQVQRCPNTDLPQWKMAKPWLYKLVSWQVMKMVGSKQGTFGNCPLQNAGKWHFNIHWPTFLS